MTTTGDVTAPDPRAGSANAFGRRQLFRYPNTLPRLGYLGIVVLTTIMLYYLYYVEGAVTPLLLPYYHMSFQFFLYLLVVSNAIGAFSAFIGGLSDKIGRANLTIYGTLVVALVQLFAIPHIHDKWGFAASYCVIGFVEGVILVSTPALMRDFSPQMGRGVAMGFWALGPTMGALCASLVATHTLAHLKPWQDQFIISGLVCLGVVDHRVLLLARALAAAPRPADGDRARTGAGRGAGQGHRRRAGDGAPDPLHDATRPDLLVRRHLVVPALLLRLGERAHDLLGRHLQPERRRRPTGSTSGSPRSSPADWSWPASSRTVARVRKPFMLFGAVCAMVMMGFLIVQTGHPHTGYYSNVLVIVLLAVSISLAYAPWMANYTEQVESHNPALTASGLAVWGWILRITVALSFLVLPYVITTSTVLVDNQTAATALQAIQAAEPYAPSTTAPACNPAPAPASVITRPAGDGRGRSADAGHPPQRLQHDAQPDQGVDGGRRPDQPPGPGPPRLQPAGHGHSEGPAVSQAEIAKVGVHSQNLASLLVAEQKLVPAQKTSPGEWKRWWTVCLIGQLVFAVLVFFMRGRWSPRAARRDLEQHERMVTEELAKLAAASRPPVA